MSKKYTRPRPAISFKKFNWYIPYEHFKMERLFLLKEILQQNGYMCKIDLKDAYSAVPLHSSWVKYIRFWWKGDLYQFLYLCFGLKTAPRVFTKPMKIPILVMRKLNKSLILIMASIKKELIEARETLTFLLETLGFLINKNKCVTSMPDFTVSRC